MSTPEPVPGDDAPDFPDNDRSFLEEQAPVEVDDDAVRANTDVDDDAGSDADAARS